MIKLNPCPRCRSPFVEVTGSDAGAVFSCAVCGLQVPVPVPVTQAVQMWNEWDRSDSTAAAATATTKLAEIHAASTASRLERILVAVIRASNPLARWQIDDAAKLVAIAREIEKSLDAQP